MCFRAWNNGRSSDIFQPKWSLSHQMLNWLLHFVVFFEDWVKNLKEWVNHLPCILLFIDVTCPMDACMGGQNEIEKMSIKIGKFSTVFLDNSWTLYQALCFYCHFQFRPPISHQKMGVVYKTCQDVLKERISCFL